MLMRISSYYEMFIARLFDLVFRNISPRYKFDVQETHLRVSRWFREGGVISNYLILYNHVYYKLTTI